MQRELQARPTLQQVQALQEQLRTWKAAMVGLLDEGDEGSGASASSGGGLESVLMSRNKKLDAEVIRLQAA